MVLLPRRLHSLRTVGAFVRHGTSWWSSSNSHHNLAPATARYMGGSSSGFFEELLAAATRSSSSAQPLKREVPQHIERPDYAEDGKPCGSVPKLPWKIPVNSAEDIECAREAGRVSREVCLLHSVPKSYHLPPGWKREHGVTGLLCGHCSVQ